MPHQQHNKKILHASTMKYPRTHTPNKTSHPQQQLHNQQNHPFPKGFVTVVIARGKHPDPSRTRKLSLPALMVLHTRVCGRVRRRRTTHPTPPQPTSCGGATTPPPKTTTQPQLAGHMRDRPARLDHQPRSLSPMPRHQRRLSLPLCHTSALPAEPRSRYPRCPQIQGNRTGF